MKRALGAAVLGGGLLALTAGAAGAQEVSADVSARLGRPTAADVQVCADGRLLSRLVGSCTQAGSGTTGSVRADRADGVRVRARVPRLAAADVSIGTRRSRPRATVSADASAAPRSRAADADADAAASLSRPRAGLLLDLDATASLAGVGLLGSGPFALVGDPAGDTLLAIGDLTLADVGGQTPAGIGVLDTGPITSGNQAAVDVGDVSPSVPVTVCGNSAGVLGDASASCTPAQPAASSGSSGTSSDDSTAPTQASGTLAGNQADASAGNISPSAPVTVCGNGVGALGDASASCGDAQPAAGSSGSGAGSGGSAGTADDSSVSATTGSLLDDTASGNQVDAGIASVSRSVPVTVCGNGVGLLGDASVACTADTSTGGIIAPPPGTTTPGGSTDTDGITGTPGSTDTSGIPGTTGLTPGTSGGAGDPVATFAPLRPSVADSSALPFTGAASDLLALAAVGLLAVGVLIVRAARPATAATEGGEDR